MLLYFPIVKGLKNDCLAAMFWDLWSFDSLSAYKSWILFPK